ncbi:hypothetical protein D9757_008153 [Collybiopsis confluens]|uniref:Uncharacterized protein n=1 Tax=Collybiopsis confluens TaxID=2823264 RepID=A0A8H5HDG2_9AGAR|nr:hypothetical protein D9757_008153 [Collybiopsis confluens]
MVWSKIRPRTEVETHLAVPLAADVDMDPFLAPKQLLLMKGLVNHLPLLPNGTSEPQRIISYLILQICVLTGRPTKTLAQDHPPPPPRGTLCEGGRVPRYILGWIIPYDEALDLFSVPEYKAEDLDYYLNYTLFPRRWESSSSQGLEKYKSMTSPTVTSRGIEKILLILTLNFMHRTDPNYQQDGDAFLTKRLEDLSFDKNMLENLKWYKVSP